MMRGVRLACLTTVGLLCCGRLQAAEDPVVKRLEAKGAKITSVKGLLQINVSECSQWTDDDYRALGGIPNVTSLSFGLGFTEASLPLLAGLKDLEAFSTNGMQLTDEGSKAFVQFPQLKRLTFFHPARSFTGNELGRLASLKLEELSIGGSATVADEALASISRIKTLKRLRLWHLRNTNDGVKRLTELPALESFMLGQSGVNMPPACPDDETIGILLQMKALKTLVLMETRYDYASLIRLKQLPELKQLSLDGIQMPEADYERLQREMPEVRMTRSRYFSVPRSLAKPTSFTT